MKKLRADLPEKVASTSGSGEISTYKMPNITASEMTHFSQADIGRSYYPISVNVKSPYKSEQKCTLCAPDGLLMGRKPTKKCLSSGPKPSILLQIEKKQRFPKAPMVLRNKQKHASPPRKEQIKNR